jgi:anti-sigma B factor antagonist
LARGRALSLALSTELKGDIGIIHADGDLDVYTAPELREEVDDAMSRAARVVIDLTDVHFIDSTALGVLVAAHQKARSSSGDLRLIVQDPFVLKILKITGFDSVFSISASLADALS